MKIMKILGAGLVATALFLGGIAYEQPSWATTLVGPVLYQALNSITGAIKYTPGTGFAQANCAALSDSAPGCSITAVTNSLGAAWDSTTTVTAQTVTILNPYATATITKMLYQTGGSGSPSFTAALQINGTPVTSCSVSVSSATPASTNCTGANTLGVNDKLQIVITSPSGTPNAATVTAVLTHPVE